VTQPVTQGTLSVAVAGSGNVVSANAASVNPQVSGTVTQLGVSQGSYVKKGDLLFTLDNPTLDAQVVQSRASYQQAQSSTLKAKQAETQADLSLETGVLQAKQSLQQAQAQVASSKVALTKAQTATPVDGNAVAAAQASLAAANTGLKTAQKNYDWACHIQKEGHAAAAKSYTAAQTGQNASYLSYQQAIANADMRTVTAPITGYVTTLSINNGDQVSGNGSSGSTSRSTSGGTTSASSVSANSPIVITNLSNLQATVQIAETDRPKVQQGQKVALTFDAVPDLTITGKVAEIDAVGTSSSGVVSYNVTVTFDVQDKRLTPGMTASASIVTAVYTDVLLVPNAAIKTDSSGGSYVQVLASPTASPQDVTVTVTAAGDSQTAVTGSIKAGDEVVTQTVAAGSTGTAATRSGLSVIGGGRAGGGGGFGGGRPGQ
jgi:multidrug efflux pump subunit AcrA (membrane-fusion protein)